MTGMDGFDLAQPVMALGEQNGWTLSLSPSGTWTKLVMLRGDERLELNWKPAFRPGHGDRLADTRLYETPTRRTRSFSLAEAQRIISAPERI